MNVSTYWQHGQECYVTARCVWCSYGARLQPGEGGELPEPAVVVVETVNGPRDLCETCAVDVRERGVKTHREATLYGWRDRAVALRR